MAAQSFSWHAVLLRGVRGEIKISLLTSLFCKLVWPLYTALVNFWEHKGWSERWFLVCGTCAIHATLYVGMALFFYMCDQIEYMQRYKFHRTKAHANPPGLVIRTLVEAFLGQVFVGPVVAYFAYDVFKYCGTPAMGAPLPPFHILFLQFFIANIVNGWAFYAAHRMLHHKLLYPYIHKQHHEYKGPISIAAEYANPVEQILANQLPTIGACLFGGFHIGIWFVWLTARLEETYEGHSGYSFYGSLPHRFGLTHGTHTCYHDFHHTKNVGNYGGPEYLDFFFGTNKPWIAIGGTEGYLALKNEKEKVGDKQM